MAVLKINAIQVLRTNISHEEDMKLLTFIRDRFPPRNDIIPVFAASLFIVYSWAILWFLQKLPGWLPYLNLWAILSIFAYTTAFTLFESCILILGLVLLSVVTPNNFLRARFISQGSSILFVAALWATIFQLLRSEFQVWTLADFILWFGISIVSIVITGVLVYRLPRLQQAIHSFCIRLTIFLFIYFPIGILGCIVVIMRNIFAAIHRG